MLRRLMLGTLTVLLVVGASSAATTSPRAGRHGPVNAGDATSDVLALRGAGAAAFIPAAHELVSAASQRRRPDDKVTLFAALLAVLLLIGAGTHRATPRPPRAATMQRGPEWRAVWSRRGPPVTA